MGLSVPYVWTDRKHRELKPHGTHSFPCAAYERSYTNAPGDILPWHFHEEFEIACADAGSVTFRTIGHTVPLQKGEMILLNSGVLHMASADHYGRLHTIVFSPLLIGSSDSIFHMQYLKPFMECKQVPCFSFARDSEETRTFVQAFQALRDNQKDYPFTVRECLERILLSALHASGALLNQAEPEDPDNRRLHEMLAYIEDHHQEEITLEDLSHATDIGKREVLRCFQRTIGESPMQYLSQYRLMKAADLLIHQPDLAIGEVSAVCGFTSAGYFTRRFHEFYQCTPQAYRKEHIGKEEKEV